MSRKPVASRVHPIVRQIIDRDCHVSLTGREVVRHVISKLKAGYRTFRSLTAADRRKLIEQCLKHHRDNFRLYVSVMRGSSTTRISGVGLANMRPRELSGPAIVRLMRKHGITIPELAFRLGTTLKKVRQVRRQGLDRAAAVRDWLEAITSGDIGPLPERYRINQLSQEAECGFCGCPLYVGEDAYAYREEVYCSTFCCRKSRGWS